jgi:hypothetical protein
MALEPRIEAVRQKYDLSNDDFWQIKQNGQWVCKHAALEIVATKANVEWLPPVIIERDAQNLITSMVVTGKMGDRTEWATGETNPTNYKVIGKQPAYPWAMSEKRAKDRVVLKLVGIHGLVYSEDESDDFKRDRHIDDPPPKSSAQLKRDGAWEEVSGSLDNDLLDCHSLVALVKLRDDYRSKVDGWPKAWMLALKDKFDAHEDFLIKQREAEEKDAA